MSDSVNELSTMHEIVQQLHAPETVKVTAFDHETTFVAFGAGMQLREIKRADIEAQRPAPFERRGTATMQTVESLIAHTVRFADADTVIFADADRSKPSLTTVFDYHRATATGEPRWGRHRAKFAFPLSDEWLAWTKADKEAMSMTDFARFLEDNVTDVLASSDGLDEHQQAFIKATGGSVASPSTLLALSVNLKVNEGSSIKEVRNLTSGEAQIEFVNTHETTIAGDVIRFPSAFIIAIPVFKNSTDAYRLLARLRYRTKGGLALWFELWRTQPTFDTAFSEACAKVVEATALPLFYGCPEA